MKQFKDLKKINVAIYKNQEQKKIVWANRF